MAKENKSKKAPAKKTTKVVSKTTTKKAAPKKKENVIIQTENSYGRTIIAALLIIVVLVGGYLAVQYKKNHGEGIYIQTAEEKKFKEEYESFNGVENNKTISIMKNNNIKYISMSEAAKILDSGDGVIYFGYASSPYSRNAVPVLLDAMTTNKLKEIYYVNLRPDNKKENDLRDEYTLDSRNKAKKTKDGDASYYDVLLALANELDDYVLVADGGKKVSTGEKRLQESTLVAVKKGVVVGFHEKTLKGHNLDKDQKLADLTKEQEQELNEMFTKVIKNYLNDDCIEEDC
ncbi:MAG: hypothetical protein II625_09960 [Bacilli bacterium]|nr:hypothetical protein [Bacilli bacterium]